MTIQIFSDFDGTITAQDSIVFLTETFGGGSRHREAVLKAFEQSLLDPFQVIEKELATVKISWTDAVRTLSENISIDPEFPDFVRWCQRHRYPLSVVSSGVRKIIRLFIGHLDIPFYGHPVDITEKGWVYRKDESADKVRLLRQARSDAKVVYIGDGISDLAVIGLTDFLFAKSRLAQHCTQKEIPYFPFESFGQIQQKLEELVRTSIREGGDHGLLSG